MSFPQTSFIGGPGVVEARPGDWYCPNPNCAERNFAKRTVCFRCGATSQGFLSGFVAAMMGNSGLRGGGGRNSLYNMELMAHDAAASVASGQQQQHHPHHRPPPTSFREEESYYQPPPPLPVGSDWKCLACQNINFARRLLCNLCNSPKESNFEDVGPNAAKNTNGYGGERYESGANFVAGGGNGGKMLPGDWICPNPACGNTNFARRNACHLCGAVRPAEQREYIPLRGGRGDPQYRRVAPY